MHVIELSGDERYRGLLDPLAVAPEALREDLASSYLIELLPQAPPAWETQVRKAVRAALERPAPSCLRVLDAAARVAPTRTRARPARRCRCGRTPASPGSAFGDGERARVAAQRPVTTIKARGLSAARAGGRARRLRPGRAARRRDAEADRRVRDAARGRRPLGAQGRAVRRGVVPARLARRAPADRPAQPARAGGERDADPGHAAADRRRRDREPDRHPAYLRPGDRRRGAPRARAARPGPRRPRARRAGPRPTGAGAA